MDGRSNTCPWFTGRPYGKVYLAVRCPEFSQSSAARCSKPTGAVPKRGTAEDRQGGCKGRVEYLVAWIAWSSGRGRVKLQSWPWSWGHPPKLCVVLGGGDGMAGRKARAATYLAGSKVSQRIEKGCGASGCGSAQCDTVK